MHRQDLTFFSCLEGFIHSYKGQTFYLFFLCLMKAWVPEKNLSSFRAVLCKGTWETDVMHVIDQLGVTSEKSFFIKIGLSCLHSSQWLAFDCAWQLFYSWANTRNCLRAKSNWVQPQGTSQSSSTRSSFPDVAITPAHRFGSSTTPDAELVGINT